MFSLQGSASFEGEESSKQRQLGASISADRITPEWKISFGVEIDHEHEEFDLDEETPVIADSRERDFSWLVVKGLGEHWSAGAMGEVESSTFENIKLSVVAAPAIEYNVFPYSQHTRRQLRRAYAVGVGSFRYFEETLFGKTEETLPLHELSLTLEQRERWGSLETSARMVAVSPRSEQEPARAPGRGVDPHPARSVGVHRVQRLAAARSAVAAAARRHRGGGAAAPPPAAERLRVPASASA